MEFYQQPYFGTAYKKDILIAIDKVRLWRVDPTKQFQSDVHSLIILIERANDTNDNSIPD